MNSSNHRDSSDESTLRALLSRADMQQIELPADLEERVRTQLVAKTVVARPAVESPRRPQKRVVWLLALTVCVAFVSLFYAVRPKETWAQVAQTVAQKPWIHILATEPAGLRHENWISFSRGISAIRRGDFVRFEDHRDGVRFEFDGATKRLVRLPLSEQSSYQSVETVFQAIFRGGGAIGEQFAEDRIVDEKRRTVEEDGKTWTDYELTLQRADEKAVVVIRVDAATKLPTSLTLSAGKERLRYEIDYPDQGPADIYALGVPREMVVDDRVPNDELARIIKTLDACRHDLDNYLAVEQPIPLFPQKLIWRKGDKWRVELVSDRDPSMLLKQIPEGVDPVTWWRERVAKLGTLPCLVCDGQAVYRCDFGLKDGVQVVGDWKKVRSVAPGQGRRAAMSFGDSSHSLPDLFSYPIVMPSPQSTISVDPKGPDGPAGSVLLDVRFSTPEPRAYRRLRYWLDPKRQFVLLKSEASDSAAVDSDPEVPPQQKHDIYEYADFLQSPRGVWYPTTVRRKHARRETDKRGQPDFLDIETYFWLDFRAELPDSLFKPTTRPSAKAVARPGEKPQ